VPKTALKLTLSSWFGLVVALNCAYYSAFLTDSFNYRYFSGFFSFEKRRLSLLSLLPLALRGDFDCFSFYLGFCYYTFK
jgi:hypothetical protein